MTHSHGSQVNAMHGAEAESDRTDDVPGAVHWADSGPGHWAEVVLDRLDQMEFTLNRETGIEGELLAAIGELGAQFDLLSQSMIDRAAGSAAPLDPTDPRFDLPVDGQIPPFGALDVPSEHGQPRHGVVIYPEVLQAALSCLTEAVQAACRRQDDRIESCVARPEPLQTALPSPDQLADLLLERLGAVGGRDLLDRLDRLERRLADGMSAIATRDLPRPDLTVLHQSIARLATGMKGFALEQRQVLAEVTMRLDQVEHSIAGSLVQDRPPAMPADLEDRISDAVPRGVQKAFAEAQATPNKGHWGEMSASQRSSIARLMSALDGWSKHHELLHATTCAKLDALLEKSVTSAETGDDVASCDIPSTVANHVIAAIEARENRIDAALNQSRDHMAAMGPIDDAHRRNAQVAAAQTGDCPIDAALHTQARVQIEFPEDNGLSIPEEADCETGSQMTQAAEKLRAHLFAVKGADTGTADPELEILTRELRIAVAETFAEAERRLSR